MIMTDIKHLEMNSPSPPQKIEVTPDYDTNLHLGGKAPLTPLLPLLPGWLWPRTVVLFRVQSIGQIDLFENYLYSIGTLEII